MHIKNTVRFHFISTTFSKRLIEMLATMWNILVEMYIGTTTWETKLKFNMHILNAFSIIFLYIFPRKILAQVDQKMWWLILSVDWPQGAQIFGQTLFRCVYEGVLG